MYVATIPNRNSRPAILLRESYRENGKVKNRTLKNLSDWPAERVELLRAALRGDGLEIERASHSLGATLELGLVKVKGTPPGRAALSGSR